MLVYIGTVLSVLTVIFSAYFLLFKKVEIKRIILFATIGLFSGTILLLGDRITTIRLPMLGEVVAKARQDASEIENIRDDVISQSKEIKSIIEQATILKKNIVQLENNLQLQEVNVRKNFLKDKINNINTEIQELENKRTKLFMSGGFTGTTQKIIDNSKDDSELAFKIDKLVGQLKQYSNELKALEKKELETKNNSE